MMVIRTRWLPVLIAGVAALSVGLMAVNAAPARAADEYSCIANPNDANCSGVQVTAGDVCEFGSQTLETVYFQDNGWKFETELRYSHQCQSNFSYTHVTQAGPFQYYYSNKVRRFKANGLPYRMEHGGWWLGGTPVGNQDVYSPMVWAPRNPAQACFSRLANDNFPCTNLH